MAKNSWTGSITINNWGSGMSANDYGGSGIKQMINCEPDPTGKYVRLIEWYADNKSYSWQDACIGVVFDDDGNYYALFEDRYLARYYNSSDYEITLIGGATEDFRSCIRRKDDIFVLQDTKLSVFRGTRIHYDTDVEWEAGVYTDWLITFESWRGQDFQKRAIMINKWTNLYIFNKTVVYMLEDIQLDSGDTNIREFISVDDEIQAVYLINGLFYIHTLTRLIIWDGIKGGSTTIVDWDNIRVLEAIALNNLGIVLAEMGDKWAIIEVQGTQKRVLYEFDGYYREEWGYYRFIDQSFFAKTYKTRKHMMCVLSNSVYIQHDLWILKLTLAGQSYRLSEYYNANSFDASGWLYASKQGVLYYDSVVAPTIYKIKLDGSRPLYPDTWYVVTEKLDGGAAGVEKNLLDVTLWYTFKNSSWSNTTAETSSFTLEYRVDEDSWWTSIATIPYSSSRQRWYNITLNKSFYEIQFRVSINRGSKLVPWREPILYSLSFNYELTNGLTS